MLGQILPDVARSLDAFPDAVGRSIVSARHFGFELSPEEESGLAGSGLRRLSDLSATLRSLEGGPILARSRLAVEHQLAQVMPSLVTSVAHIEMLLEVCQSGPSEMSVFELLTSMPDRGTERPYRPISVARDGLGTLVYLSPRVALRLLSAWLSASIEGAPGEQGLVVATGASTVMFSLVPHVDSDLVIRLPLFSADHHTSLVLGAALRPLGGFLLEKSLHLPVRSL